MKFALLAVLSPLLLTPHLHAAELGPTATLSDWKIARAIVLDGIDDYVQVPDHPTLRPSCFTLSAWINTEDATLMQPVVAKSAAAGNWVSYMLRVQDGGRVSLVVGNAAQGSDAHWLTRSTVRAGTWHHVAAAWHNERGDATDATIYLDGVRQDLEMNRSVGYGPSFTPGYTAEPLLIGRDQFPSGHFRGAIEDLDIIPRVLSTEEILAAYHRGAQLRDKAVRVAE